MSTARQLINSSLRLIGVVQQGENPTAADMEVVRQALDVMIDSWSNDRLAIYTVNPYNFPLVGGQQQYTIGPGGQWNIQRPMSIEQAYVHYMPSVGAQIVDLPIVELNDAQWAAIAVKGTTSTFPMKMYDNGNYPLRTLYFWPIPNQTQEVTLWLWQPLIDFNTLDDLVTFPPGYERAFKYNLAVECAPEFGKQVPAEVAQVAVESFREIKNRNNVPQVMQSGKGITAKKSVFNWIVDSTTT